MDMNEIIAQLKSLNEQADKTIASMKEKSEKAYEEYESELFNRLANIHNELKTILNVIEDNKYYTVHTYDVKSLERKYAVVFRYNCFELYETKENGYVSYDNLVHRRSLLCVSDTFSRRHLNECVANSSWRSAVVKYIADNWDVIKDDVLKNFMKEYSANIEEKLRKETEIFNARKAEYTFKVKGE